MREDNAPPSFFRERRLLKLGPVVLVRSAWSYVIVGWLLATAALVMLLRSEALFASEAAAEMGIWQNTLLLKFLAIAIGLLFTFRLKFPGKPGFFVSTVLYALVPCATFVMVECLNGNAAYDRAPEIIFMNLLAYAVVYLLFLVIFGNYRWSVFVGTALFYAFALACHFVLSFPQAQPPTSSRIMCSHSRRSGPPPRSRLDSSSALAFSSGAAACVVCAGS